MKIFPLNKLYLSQSKIKNAGRGVFADINIKKDELIEMCPVYVFPRSDYLTLKKTSLRNYYFMWGKVTVAICFGFGSFYNHSYDANATYKKQIKDQTIEFIAVRDIQEDEEILVNYNYGKPLEKRKLWIKGVKPAL